MKLRHRARRLAMQALCCLDAQGDHAMDLAVEFIRESDEELASIALAQTMLAAAWAYRQQADAELDALSRHWDLRRMAMVDRNILRLAIWEIVQEKVPPKIIITEAIRMAKEFSTAESPRFINGILDAVAKRLGPETGEAPQAESGEAADADPSS